MNMRLKQTFWAIVLATGVVGCNYLDTKIDTGVTQNQLEYDYSRVMRLGQTAYTYLNNGFTAIDNNIMAAVTDEAEQTASVSNAQMFNNGSWNAFNNPLDVYGNHYQAIRAANFFLDYAGKDYKRLLALNRDTLNAGSTAYWKDVRSCEWLIAENHVLLAWYYFELIKRYGGVPLVEKTLDINGDLNLPRAKFDDIVTYIVAQIDNYKDGLQLNWKTTTDYVAQDGRLTKDAALALKSRILLYAASPLYNESNDLTKWEKAAAAAYDVIASGIAQDKRYSLHPNYAQLFQENNSVKSSEVIWSIRLRQDNAAISILMETNNYPIATPGGHSGVTPSQNLVSAYEYKGVPIPNDPYANRDPRLAASIVTNGSTWNARYIDISKEGTDSHDKPNASRTGYYLKKFLVDGIDLLHPVAKYRSWIVFRYAEILLNFAEAMNEAYGPDDTHNYGMTARDAINMVRNRTGVQMPQVDAPDQTAMRAAIKHERRIELAFEDHRYWDLRRWKDGAELSKPLMGIRATKIGDGLYSYSDPFTVEERVFVTPKMYFFPIPDAEIRKSKGILEQNPDW